MDAPTPPNAPPEPKGQWKRDAAAALFVVVAAAALMAGFTRQWLLPADVPREYHHDYLVYLTWVQTMIEDGGPLRNSRVGQPLGADWRGFPSADGWLSWRLIRGLTAVRPDPAWALNWFYWLTFPLVGLGAYAAVRLMGVSRLVSICVAILYTLMPYHYLRSGHVFMTAYFLVPLSVLAAVRLWERSQTLGRRNWPTLWWLSLAALTGLGYVYYAYFAYFLMLVVGVARWRTERSWRPLALAVVWCAASTATLAATMLPEIRYLRTHPKPADRAVRKFADSEMFGVKPIQLFLPTPGHQLGAFAKVRAEYQRDTVLTNENETAALGMVGGAGLVCLLFRLVFRGPDGGPEPEDSLSVMAVTLVALITLGGLGAMTSWLQHAAGVNPWIRGYNRGSIVLAFLALAGLGLMADRWLAAASTAKRRCMKLATLLAVTSWGVFDQSPAHRGEQYLRSRRSAESDAAFFGELEAGAPPGALVFTLGYRYYPECAIEPKTDYAFFRPYLNTTTMTFSYGDLRGEANDMWARDLAARPAAELADTLARMEAHGVLVHRPSIADGGAALERTLRTHLGEPPAVSPDGEFAFFGLRRRIDQLWSASLPGEWAARRERLQNPLVPVWRDGFSVNWFVTEATGMTRMFAGPATVHVANRTPATRTMTLRYTAARYGEDLTLPPAWLKVSVAGHDEISAVTVKGEELATTFNVPPGGVDVRFTPSATREGLDDRADRKTRHLTLSNISWAEQ